MDESRGSRVRGSTVGDRLLCVLTGVRLHLCVLRTVGKRVQLAFLFLENTYDKRP